MNKETTELANSLREDAEDAGMLGHSYFEIPPARAVLIAKALEDMSKQVADLEQDKIQLKAKLLIDTLNPNRREHVNKLLVENESLSKQIEEIESNLKFNKYLVDDYQARITAYSKQVAEYDKSLQNIAEGLWWDGNEPFEMYRLESWAKSEQNRIAAMEKNDGLR